MQKCTDYQHAKYLTQKPPRLLQPISPPTKLWEDLSLDFVTRLPPYHGSLVILVVVDHFSKGSHLGMLSTCFTASKVAQLFIDLVCNLHGFPHSLISDQDPIFMSHFWQELYKLSGTKLWMSTSYHPQSNSQIEVLNRVLEQYFDTNPFLSKGEL